jgi:uncharacterized lipoprotein NlpE involved in copper resistance
MKKSFLALVASFLLLGFISCGTTGAGNSSDWAGTYTGVIPAASAEGINVSITLNANETYALNYQYIGKSSDNFTNTGTFSWNPEGSTIILNAEREGDFPKYYKLGKNTLTQLDLAGNKITGKLAKNYILKKQK